ncbi:MAG: glycosyltransferase family 2 protein [bacterium]|nr:glycosyltransferase family 2 protein [bacterium]
MRLPYSLSIIIPAYNEARRLPQTLRDVVTYLAEHAASFEVLVVDDGSTDGTVKLVQEASKRWPQIRLIQNDGNQGKGASVQHGMRLARGDFIVYMDADHSTNINELYKLPALLKHGGDVFVSSRYVYGSDIQQHQPWQRVVISRVSNMVIRVFAVPGIRDTQNGFKIVRGTAASKIAPHLLLKRWAFDVEFLYVARALGFRLVEFPVTWHNTTGSKLNVARDLRNTVGEFWTFIWNRLRSKYPGPAKPPQRAERV